MNLAFQEIVEGDLPELTRVMTRAFDDDARKHLGKEKGGPEGYDNGDFFRTWLFPYKESLGYKILLDSRLVGAFIVWVLPSGDNILGTIFVDPDYQNQGIGTRAWAFIEASFPETRSWTLHTPPWATRNHRFYEAKCGFQKVREEDTPGETWPTYVYQKTMKDA